MPARWLIDIVRAWYDHGKTRAQIAAYLGTSVESVDQIWSGRSMHASDLEQIVTALMDRP